MFPAEARRRGRSCSDTDAGREKEGFDYASAQVLRAQLSSDAATRKREENLKMIERWCLSLGFKRGAAPDAERHDAVIGLLQLHTQSPWP